MKVLPTEVELKQSFEDFALFTFELLDKIKEDNKYLKFAAVNSQIALELFFKYLFVKSGRVKEIQKKKRRNMLKNSMISLKLCNTFTLKENGLLESKKNL